MSLTSCLGRNGFALQGRGKATVWTEQYVKCCKDGVVNPSFTKTKESGLPIASSSASASRNEARDKSSPGLLPC